MKMVKNYGLLHSDNTWLQTQEFAWLMMCSLVHGQNHVPYQRTDGLKAGNTIKKDHISVKIQRILLLIQILN